MKVLVATDRTQGDRADDYSQRLLVRLGFPTAGV
jgi:hypothetical protein